jgi:hypothetical protein
MGSMVSGITSAASNLPETTGIASLGAGLQDLFGGGPDSGPAADFVGPPSPYQAPNFAQGFVQGILGQQPNLGVDVPTAGGQIGGGLGELIKLLQGLGGGGAMPPPVLQGGGMTQGIRMLPGYRQALAPEGGLIHNLIKSYTAGILRGGIPSGQQV